MKFNSIHFLTFFPIVATLFFIVPQKWRWVLLLAASYYFYISWNPEYIVILLAVTAIGYLGGAFLAREGRPARRRALLTGCLVAVLGSLFLFKYAEAANGALHAVADQIGLSSLQSIYLVLPLGISFYTFQTISYLVDVYRGVAKPEKHAGIYALFIAFFPHLAAGPIARTNLLLPQFYSSQSPDYERIVSGLQRMAWGFFKKLVIADRLALLVNAVYEDPAAFTGLPLILATYAFAFQVYCDFSGYADIAIGAARVMGFTLQENFQQPYYAQSIPDFWRRWHITLYTWLRDYIFYPLTRVLHRSGMTTANLIVIVLPPMLTMLASGLWHGTSWTFIIWGALHGLYMVLSILLSRAKSRLQPPFTLPPRAATALRVVGTFHLVCFAWIFFRANSLADAVYIIQHLFVGLELQASVFSIVPGGWYEWLVAMMALVLMEFVHWQQVKNGSLREVIRRQPVWIRWPVYYALVLIIFMFGKFQASEFIYSRF